MSDLPRHDQGKTLVTRGCGVCGAGFLIPADSVARYCSERCRTMVRSARIASGQMYKKGRYKGQPYDSSLELAHMQALDQQKVSWRRAHGIRIRYYDPKSKKERTYLPDLLVTVRGQVIMQEIKAAALVNDATVQAKAAAARVYCDAKGWRYEFVTMPGQIGAG